MPLFSQPVHGPYFSQHTGEFFSNAHNTTITGSSFTNVNHSTSRKDGFQILQEHVAASAFHNSKERFDPPRCHEHTREAILDEIFEWIVGNVDRETWIAWLNGAAGAGKSAICQSIAERCILHGILVASFFFFRHDNTRNTMDPLVATLAYQIIQLLPETKQHIVAAIESNPLIFEQTFEAQIDLLIVRPLRRLQALYPALKLLLIIDGVDECKGVTTQKSLIQTIEKLLRAKNLPLIVLFGSRRENQLLMAFHPCEMNGILTQLPLDDKYHAEADILRFLNDSFDKIKQTHPFGENLSADWPSPGDVRDIVNKSSGQFIYASVVINFLSAPTESPSVRLEIIRGLRPSGRLTPFAQLDALYRHIFSQVDDIQTTLEFLAYYLFTDGSELHIVFSFFGYEDADVQSLLAPLVSVMDCDLNKFMIPFHHASLPDFLCDKRRSREYCINNFATPLCIRWFKKAKSGLFRDLPNGEQNDHIPDLLEHAEMTPELYASLVSYTPSQNHSAYSLEFFAVSFLVAIWRMKSYDDGKAYIALSGAIVRYVKKEFPKRMSLLEQRFDVPHILAWHLAAEEVADISPGPASAADTDSGTEESTEVSIFNARASTSSVEATSNMHHRRRLGELKRYHRPEPYPNSATRASLSGRSKLP